MLLLRYRAFKDYMDFRNPFLCGGSIRNGFLGDVIGPDGFGGGDGEFGFAAFFSGMAYSLEAG